MSDRRAAWTVPGCLAVLALGVSCDPVTQETLVAAYELGPKELGRAVLLQFPEVLTPESTRWPEGADAVSVDVEAERGAVVDLSAETWLAGALVRVRPARLRFEDGPAAFERYELWAAPESSTSIDEAAVLLGEAAPTVEGESVDLKWTEDGPRWFSYAVAGGHAEQGGTQRFALFVRGRTRYEAAPGDELPRAPADGDGATRVIVEIELQVGP